MDKIILNFVFFIVQFNIIYFAILGKHFIIDLKSFSRETLKAISARFISPIFSVYIALTALPPFPNIFMGLSEWSYPS